MTGPVKKTRAVDLTLLQKLLRIFQDSNRNSFLFAAVLEGSRYFVRFLSSSASFKVKSFAELWSGNFGTKLPDT